MSRKEPSELIDTTPPSAFPRWLRRIDPTLEIEETCTLFQAFRKRQLYHSGSKYLPGLMKSIATVNPLVLSLPLLTLMVFGSFLFKYVSTLTSLAIIFITVTLTALSIGLVFLTKKLTRNQKVSENTMPLTATSIFSTQGIMIRPAIDLWLSGVKGSDIIDALYLEERQKCSLPLLYYFAIIVQFIAPYTYIEKRGFFHLVGISALILFVVLMIKGYKNMIRLHCHKFRMEHDATTGNQWLKGFFQTKKTPSPKMENFKPLVFFIAGFALLILGGEIISILEFNLSFSSEKIAFLLPDKSYFLDLTGLILMIMVIMYGYSNKIQPEEYEEFFKDNRIRADIAFDYYMNVTILQELTHERWVELYTQANLIETNGPQKPAVTTSA